MRGMKRPGSGGSNRNLLMWLAIAALLMIFYEISAGNQAATNKIAFSEFLNKTQNGEISEVIVRGDMVDGKMYDGSRFNTLVPSNYPGTIELLTAKGVKIEVMPVETAMSGFFGLLLSYLPLFLLIGVWIYVMRQMQGGGGKAMGFGKSKAKMLSDKNNNVTFKDVAGIDEAREELEEIVDFLKDPTKFKKLGGKIPKGCLLVGSPGTGKTLLARSIAGEAKVPFFSISGSDFVEMFVGVGASRVRDMFSQAKKHAPCIIFIDEIDAVGRQRGAGMGGGNDEREQTLNQMLVEMDGFAENEGVIVLAATNRPDVLDPALLRPGRFDRQVTVPVPDINGRTQILKVHSKKAKLGPDVDLRVIARGTPGFTGADLANLINESALLAARKNRQIITMQEMEDAKDKVMMGAERKSMVMKDEEKELTAYHEGGHALVTVMMKDSDPIHKATIIPRGRALGMVMRLPEDDRFSVTRAKLRADIAVAMGGRVAEEIIFGYDMVTTGASSDIKMATNLAKRMVTQWGMSDDIGPILVGDEREESFLGHSMGHENHNSEVLTSRIDAEVRRIVDEGYEKAREILTKHSKELELLAKNLLEFETLTGKEIVDLVKHGKPVERKIEELSNDDGDDVSSIPSTKKAAPKKKRAPSKAKKVESESEEKSSEA